MYNSWKSIISVAGGRYVCRPSISSVSSIREDVDEAPATGRPRFRGHKKVIRRIKQVIVTTPASSAKMSRVQVSVAVVMITTRRFRWTEKWKRGWNTEVPQGNDEVRLDTWTEEGCVKKNRKEKNTQTKEREREDRKMGRPSRTH